MSQSASWKGLKLGTPATYRIRVQGHIDNNWSDRFGGMILTRETTAQRLKVTILQGHLTDQAALSGVLNTLYDFHLPLLSVENLDEK
ncbi:MAG: hypothetical protein AB8I58_11380 [Anaerolineales bacterium]|jgi:hypothetical protein